MEVEDSRSKRGRRADSWLQAEIKILLKAIRKGLRDNGKDLASAIAFWTFFSIFPLLLGISAAAGYLLDSEAAQAQLFEIVTRALPGSAEFVQKNVDSVVAARGAFGLVALVGLFWSGSAAFGAITRTVNRALGAKRKHPFLLSRLRYFAMTVVASVLLLLSIAVSAALEIVPRIDLKILERLGVDPEAISQVTGTLTSLAFAILTFALIYKVTPYIKVSWRQVLPGAVLAAGAFEVLKRAFLLYLGRIAHLEAIYGSLSSIIVLLLWLYVSAWVLIFGAEYNIVRWRERHGESNLAEADA